MKLFGFSLFESKRDRLIERRNKLTRRVKALVEWTEKEDTIGALMCIKEEWVDLKSRIAMIDIEIKSL